MSISLASGSANQQSYNVTFDDTQKKFAVSVQGDPKPMLDAQGKPVLGANGKPVIETTGLTMYFPTAQAAAKFLKDKGFGNVAIAQPQLPTPKNTGSLSVGSAKPKATPEASDAQVIDGAKACGSSVVKGGPSDLAHGVISDPPTNDDRVMVKKMVVDLQRQLGRARCDVGPPDGVWGPQSKIGLEQFHKRYDLDIAMYASVNNLDRNHLPPGELAKIASDKADHLPPAPKPQPKPVVTAPKAKTDAAPALPTPKVDVSGMSGSDTNWFVTVQVDTGLQAPVARVYDFPTEGDRQAFLAEVQSMDVTSQTDVNLAAGRHHDKQWSKPGAA